MSIDIQNEDEEKEIELKENKTKDASQQSEKSSIQSDSSL